MQTATCDTALPEGRAPDWVQLIPVAHGPVPTRDGRRFVVDDLEGIIADFTARAVDLVIDYEHAADNAEARARGPVAAAGWIKALRADAAGLWGRVEWTATARQMIEAGEYRYLSPTFLFDPRTGIICRLQGAGLVHRPNLPLKALSAEGGADLEPPMLPADSSQTAVPDAVILAKLRTALGLPAEATPEELLAVVGRMVDALSRIAGKPKAEVAAMREAAQMVPDPARFVPVETMTAMLQERRQERAQVAEGQAQEKVRAAMQRGYISPAMKDWAVALCRSDEAAFDTFLEKSGPIFATIGRPSHARNLYQADAKPGVSAEELAVCTQLGLDPGRLST